MFQASSPGKLLIATVFAGVFSATAANANTITITPIGGSNLDPVTISTTSTIVGLYDPSGIGVAPTGVGSLTQATGFAFSGNPEEEAELLEASLGIVGEVFTPTAGPAVPEFGSFSTDFQFFSIKSDGWIAFFYNFTGGEITLNYADAPGGGNGAGLSHSTEFNGLVPTTFNVPGPAVGAGLPGLIAACGGLLAFARRRRKKLA